MRGGVDRGGRGWQGGGQGSGVPRAAAVAVGGAARHEGLASARDRQRVGGRRCGRHGGVGATGRRGRERILFLLLVLGHHVQRGRLVLVVLPKPLVHLPRRMQVKPLTLSM